MVNLRMNQVYVSIQTTPRIALIRLLSKTFILRLLDSHKFMHVLFVKGTFILFTHCIMNGLMANSHYSSVFVLSMVVSLCVCVCLRICT